MITFLAAIVMLVIGYVIYGSIVERVFKPCPALKTPAMRKDADGVDYVPMNWKKVLLIQFISIAGTGPIFGAIAGAMWGPAAYFWIVFGCIFAGATHDYLSGMLSVRNNGASASEIVGKYLGSTPRNIMRVFSIVLLILVGTVFITSPAMIFNSLMIFKNLAAEGTRHFLFIAIVVIIIYYIAATISPIDKIIGRIYPAFGVLLTFMAVGILITLFTSGQMQNAPEFEFRNFHPAKMAIFPFLFITIACGAISGFHATQAPLMARCMRNEKEGRRIFYGSMVLEGVVAMVWAAAAMTFFGGTEGLSKAGPAPVVVNTVSIALMGTVLGTIAIVGVIFFPITSGDTAFRAARLTLADSFKFSQKPIKNRLLLALPLFAIGVALTWFAIANAQNFGIIWRYFAWSNQTLATIMLWAGAVYLAKTGKFYWIALIPATFMTVVVICYIIIAPEGLRLPYMVGIIAGLVTAAALFAAFIYFIAIKQRGTLAEEEAAQIRDGERE
ncbi:MAG: carbon starvation protein A [Spirochaetes bacterium]|nr:carbon starvation protein A [Spirochaetota bacterium]